MSGVLPATGTPTTAPGRSPRPTLRPAAPAKTAQAARAALPDGWLVIRVRDALAALVLQVVGLRLEEVDGKRAGGSIEPGGHQHTPWGPLHGGVDPTAIQADASAGVGCSGRPVVLFDFDGVLIRGDSYAHLVRGALQRSWWRRLAMLPVLAAAMPMLKVPALRPLGQRPAACSSPT